MFPDCTIQKYDSFFPTRNLCFPGFFFKISSNIFTQSTYGYYIVDTYYQFISKRSKISFIQDIIIHANRKLTNLIIKVKEIPHRLRSLSTKI